jgi:hypothetical protein
MVALPEARRQQVANPERTNRKQPVAEVPCTENGLTVPRAPFTTGPQRMPSRFWICSSGMPFVSGITSITQINWPTIITA